MISHESLSGQLRVKVLFLAHPVLLDLDEEVPVAQDGPILIGGLAAPASSPWPRRLRTSPPRQADVPMSPALCRASSSLSILGL